tara:strand:- start:546 stop:689 length:144 start_codon:yes stop_codon:yes gene_type:complete
VKLEIRIRKKLVAEEALAVALQIVDTPTICILESKAREQRERPKENL